MFIVFIFMISFLFNHLLNSFIFSPKSLIIFRVLFTKEQPGLKFLVQMSKTQWLEGFKPTFFIHIFNREVEGQTESCSFSGIYSVCLIISLRMGCLNMRWRWSQSIRPVVRLTLRATVKASVRTSPAAHASALQSLLFLTSTWMASMT